MSDIEHLGDLTPDSKNARRHNEKNVGMIVDALHEVGAARSIVIDEHGRVLAGNATIEAAAQAGIERVQVVDADGETLVAVRRTGLTEAQKTRLALYDNRTAELADWDPEVLAGIMADDGALEGLFSDFELADILGDLLKPEVAEDPGAQVDKAAELQQKWGTALGQVWEVGDHRIVCGDCTDAAVVEAVMRGERAGAVVTDLPYNIGKDYGTWNDSLPSSEFWGRVIPSWLKNIKGALADSSHFVTTFSERGLHRLISLAEAEGFIHRHTGVWHNPSRLAGSWPGQWPYGWEPILDFTVGGWRKLDNGNGVGFSDVWIIESPIGTKDSGMYHPAERPLRLYIDLVRLVTGIKEPVLDPFLGSGTTAVACQQLGRKCRGVEIEPKYVAVTLERLADMGLEPRLVE